MACSMCGRFTLTKDVEDITNLLDDLALPDQPVPVRYNIAPAQPVATVLRQDGLRLTYTQWGLVPGWATDPAIGNRLINARSETAAEKPSFRGPFKRKRCLIPADGFFEWHGLPGQKQKQPVYIRMRSGAVFAFAGLWDHWQGPDGSELVTSTILTTSPNKLLEPIHSRMPAILSPDAYSTWLNPDVEGGPELQALLRPHPSEDLEYFAVSTRVNNPRHDDADCIEPDTRQEQPGQLDLF